MGCGLAKLEKAEENSPGKIYSTLKRPQVETKVGTAYCYSFLDFTIGKDEVEGSSALCLRSMHELPAQLHDLYQQGFVLTAVHSFIHPAGQEEGSMQQRQQQQLYRAVLIKLAESSENKQQNNDPHRLEMDMCLSSNDFPDTDVIQGYMKKVQDAAEQGVTFVGFVQQHGFPLTSDAQEDKTLSLHSSPSSAFETLEDGPSVNLELEAATEEGGCGSGQGPGTERETSPPALLNENEGQADVAGSGNNGSEQGEDSSQHPSDGLTDPPTDDAQQHKDTEEAPETDTLTHNNNKEKPTEGEPKLTSPTQSKKGVQMFALFNHPHSKQNSLKYYTVKVPLRIHKKAESVSSLEANWLDHMTQHFTNGASLVDGYFHLGPENDSLSKSVDGVFIFQEDVEVDSSAVQAYDAIVVEQWTVFEGFEVKTDYIPLLKSLASYGWRLTCVLPTPIVKTNSEGNLATKQIVFLQRPFLPRKKKESKKLSFKALRSSNKNSIKDAPKNKKKNSSAKLTPKELEDQKIVEDVEKGDTEESEKGTGKEGNESGNQRSAEEEAGEDAEPQDKMDTEDEWKEETGENEEPHAGTQDSEICCEMQGADVSEASEPVQETASSDIPQDNSSCPDISQDLSLHISID
ncbi:raftlin isoform X2 [Amia ocellicauda]|uniref:raftlin isoform X2 n=1 Tax=Amia ocellicauda TaxID=2972642 RepID=UPI003464B957